MNMYKCKEIIVHTFRTEIPSVKQDNELSLTDKMFELYDQNLSKKYLAIETCFSYSTSHASYQQMIYISL